MGRKILPFEVYLFYCPKSSSNDQTSSFIWKEIYHRHTQRALFLHRVVRSSTPSQHRQKRRPNRRIRQLELQTLDILVKFLSEKPKIRMTFSSSNILSLQHVFPNNYKDREIYFKATSLEPGTISPQNIIISYSYFSFFFLAMPAASRCSLVRNQTPATPVTRATTVTLSGS